MTRTKMNSEEKRREEIKERRWVREREERPRVKYWPYGPRGTQHIGNESIGENGERRVGGKRKEEEISNQSVGRDPSFPIQNIW